MNNSNRHFITTRLEQRRDSNLYRTQQVRTASARPAQLSSNDYLGLAQHPRVKAAAQQAIDNWGVGSTGSPLLSGYTQLHQQLEETLCDWLGFEDAILFNTGFAANHGAITCLLQAHCQAQGGRIYADRLIHASMVEGMLNSGIRFKRVPHLTWPSTAQTHDWFISESIYSMDGDRLSITQSRDFTEQSPVQWLLDDAHGIGVIGEHGEGYLGQLNQQVKLGTITFGKALGASGAALVGSRDDIDEIRQFCREYIYSTAMPPMQVAAILASIEIVRGREGQLRRDALNERIARMKELIKKYQYHSVASDSAIQTIILGEEGRAMATGKRLKEAGIDVSVVRPPTVPKDTARLRISLNSTVDMKMIDVMFDHLNAERT